jgi:hypothetical protein
MSNQKKLMTIFHRILNSFVPYNSYKDNCQVSRLDFMNKLAKQLLTSEMPRVSSPYVSRGLRGSTLIVLGVKQSYPHTLEEKLQQI